MKRFDLGVIDDLKTLREDFVWRMLAEKPDASEFKVQHLAHLTNAAQIGFEHAIEVLEHSGPGPKLYAGHLRRYLEATVERVP